MAKKQQNMKRVKPLFSLVNQFAGGSLALYLFGVVLPVLLLVIVGFVTLYQHGYLVYFLAFLAVVSALSLAARWWQARKQQAVQIELKNYVEPLGDWSQAEQAIWERLNASILQKLESNNDWYALQEHGIALALEVASEYGKKELDFTVPEGLQLIEEVSRQYRKVLYQMAPGVDVMTVSHLKRLYDIQHKHGKTAKEIYRYGTGLWRAVRMVNPTTAMLSEIRRKVLSGMTDHAKASLQHNAQRALLQEVVKVCINLYSGRFVVETSGSDASKASLADLARTPEALEPVRVVLVGQASAGKSSLVNALLKDMQAETDPLPSTGEVRAYACAVDGVEELRLIDMPGLDGSKKALDNAFEQITQADLVLWVLKANQSARQLDAALQEKLAAFYAENISRKKPVVLALLNQVDRLPPANEWAPPYDLTDTSSAKVKIINEAIAYNRTILPVADAIYPLALPEGQTTFGLAQLEAEIQSQYENAKTVQRNRRRADAKKAEGMAGQVKRLFKGGKEVAKWLV